jgi:hypothetical protein
MTWKHSKADFGLIFSSVLCSVTAEQLCVLPWWAHADCWQTIAEHFGRSMRLMEFVPMHFDSQRFVSVAS